MSKVSLIVPVYQAEPWIDECMASIHAQTYKDLELIVIDDEAGTGAAAARNRGLDLATGEYVMFCDADDYLEPQAIEVLVGAMEDVELVCGSFRKFGLFEQVVSHPSARLQVYDVAKYVLGNLSNPRSNQMLSGCWAKLYQRELVDKFPALATAEDMAFNFDYLTRCEHVGFVEDIVYNNRKRTGSLSTTFDDRNRYGLFDVVKALNYVDRFLDGTGIHVNGELDTSKIYHALLYAQRIGPDALRKVFP